MENKSFNYDATKLTEDQRRQLETYNQQRDQIQAIKDIADMVQELVSIADDNAENIKQIEALGAILTDAREQLVALNAKEAPKAPEVAKPIVEAVTKLEKALGKLNVSPQVNVASPNVNVDAPDLTAFNKILKEEIPKAFKEAIKLIPKTDIKIPESEDRWDEVLEQLRSIDTASRMKPIPGSMTISNTDDRPIPVYGTVRTIEPTYAERLDDTSTPTTAYIGKAVIGSADASAVWQISKLDTSSGLIKTWADGDADFNNIWDNRASLSYS